MDWRPTEPNEKFNCPSEIKLAEIFYCLPYLALLNKDFIRGGSAPRSNPLPFFVPF